MTELERVRAMYQKVFMTEEGKQVLADILNDCGFYSLQDIEKLEDVARINVARRILGKMGVWEEKNLFDIAGAYVGGHKGFFKRLLSAGKER